MFRENVRRRKDTHARACGRLLWTSTINQRSLAKLLHAILPFHETLEVIHVNQFLFGNLVRLTAGSVEGAPLSCLQLSSFTSDENMYIQYVVFYGNIDASM